MTSKHTPGPWDVGNIAFVRKGGVSYPLAVDETRRDGESWLDMRYRIKPELKANEAEERANCHLIAAAPELLEALEALVGHSALFDREYLSRCLNEKLDAGRAAIAKAKGEA